MFKYVFKRKWCAALSSVVCPGAPFGQSFKFNANLDMLRIKSILSEDVQKLFVLMEVLTYPGPVALLVANGQLLDFVGKVTFKVTIEGRTTSW